MNLQEIFKPILDFIMGGVGSNDSFITMIFQLIILLNLCLLSAFILIIPFKFIWNIIFKKRNKSL